MKTELDVLNILYSYFNKTTVTSLLDGNIYLKKRPSTSDKKDLVITNLPILADDTQSIVVFLNAYALDSLENGMVNVKYFDLIAKALITLIENFVKTTGTFFTMEIIDQGVVNDNERINTSYMSIRLLCHIER